MLQLLLQVIIASIHNYLGTKTRLEFKGSCLKHDKIVYDHDKVVNICIVYEISKNFNSSSYSTLENVQLI